MEQQELKKKLQNLKEKIINKEIDNIKNEKAENYKSVIPNRKFVLYKEYDLNKKIDHFINWYSKNCIEEFVLDKKNKIKTVRNLIEKMAIWYELIYSNDEIYRQIPELERHYGNNIDNIMFRNNPYIKTLFDKNDDINDLEWKDFYNKDVFIASLSLDERYLLNEPKYPSIVYYDYEKSGSHFHLAEDGTITDDEWNHSGGKLENMHIIDAVNLLKNNGYEFNKDNEIIKVIEDYNKKCYQYEELLNCVMYLLISRGGSILGAYRAFMFAKEFDLNIDIPMVYGINYENPRLRLFINEYLKLGGKKDLVCLENYDKENYSLGIIPTVKISDLLKNIWYSKKSRYTPEEDKLHNELVSVLASQVPYDELERMDELKNKSYNELKKEKKLIKK